MTVPATWTRHRPIALAIAADYRIPGLDADDVRQEALVALWEACRCHDPERGPFPPFARLVVKRRLVDLLRAATSQGRSFQVDPDAEAADPRDRIAARLELLQLAKAAALLSDRERAALAGSLNGVPVGVSKSHARSLERARAKLGRLSQLSLLSEAHQ